MDTLVNAISSPDLNAIELIDPNRIQFYVENMAKQINDFRMTYSPPKRVIDLSKWISDITIETSVQGACLLEVTIIDPAWTMFMRDSKGVSFIDADDTGYLWPPVEVTFPHDISDATWRLAQVRVSTDLTQANVTLVFEDKIVSELREHSRQQKSGPNQTRAEFIQNLVKEANRSPAYPGEVDIRFKALLPHETFTTEDLATSSRLPKSSKQQYAPPARKDANKNPVAASTPRNLTLAQELVDGTDISLEWGANSFFKLNPRAYSQMTPPPPPPGVSF